jgi:tRNA pseudouridine38-40 synthase
VIVAEVVEDAAPTVRIRLDISYDGADFVGWARQPGRRTVQSVLEEALTAVLHMDTPARLTVAGRTDAGVHAAGQVAHCDVPEENWLANGEAVPRRLAGLLPNDVRVWSARPAPDGFDARFSAIGRRYAYRVSDAPYGADPLRRRSVLWHPRPLDEAVMNEAAERLLGEHDFASFCRRREGATTIRALRRLTWSRGASGGLLVADVRADAFCHSMVRALIGSLLPVGDGRQPVTFPGEVLAAEARHPNVIVVPPHGLTLEEIYYPSDDRLAARAVEARNKRTLSV